MINFEEEFLVNRYGSWVRVQVEFYDYLFKVASHMCPAHFNEKMSKTSLDKRMEMFQQHLQEMEQLWKTPEEAWIGFLETERRKIDLPKVSG